MRNPNGYGSIYKLSGKRRKPFAIRKTIGWTDDGKQIRQIIGYYESRAEALKALGAFNEHPNLPKATSDITFSDVYEKWKENKFDDVGKSAINGYNAAYEACTSLYNMKFINIKTIDMQEVIKTCGKGHGTLRKIKVLFNQLFKFAMENDIVQKDYSQYVKVSKELEKTSGRKPFTENEIKTLFDLVNTIDYVDTILIMIFTGLRIGELIIIKNSDVDLENKTITGGIKTDAGKDRIIPISNKILDLVASRVSHGYEYLIVNSKGKPFKYDNYYREKFTPIMERLGFKHKPHDCRHTFATLMSNAGADTIALQKIIGHANYETTANIYTHKDIEQLRKAIDLI